jgi:hypothetical protein
MSPLGVGKPTSSVFPATGFRRKELSCGILRVLIRVFALAFACSCAAFVAYASCSAPQNPIEAENCLPGNPQSEWYVLNAGSPNIQGFTTDISVNVGQAVSFKVATSASAYTIDIYRLGYYQGNGARKVASITPSATLPQTQPPCLTDRGTGLTDCGNWAVSASWAVPATATSGVYFARLFRPDTGDASPVVFVVRNDSSHSDILFQTSDTTWHAYNDYGGSSLYTGNPVGRAYKVSYNRPFSVPNGYTWLLADEFPMIRWLEANGYDVSYFTGVDTDRNGGLIQQHKIFMSVGHDEYWSGHQRANVESARAAGVNLAFFSGNEIAWKTRWEPSIDGTNTPYRTLFCHKETEQNHPIDPSDPLWPGTAVPANPDIGPDSPVELGVSFRSDVNGYITGIRFYKSAANTGAHVGNLWSSTGTLLASATFTNETASGWQQVNFANPVAITANTLYVASYFSPAGHYSADCSFFAPLGVDHAPLHAPADGPGSPNGVFAYSNASAFPSNTHQSANYWVDALFNTSPQ